jgi:hypothetical protein
MRVPQPGPIPHVEPIPYHDINDVHDYVRNNPSKEGVVLLYPGMFYFEKLWWPFMVKIKNIQYILGLDSLDNLDKEGVDWGKIARFVVSGRGDDLRSLGNRVLSEYVDTVESLYGCLVDVLSSLMESDKLPRWVERRSGDPYVVGRGLVYNVTHGVRDKTKIIKKIQKVIRRLENGGT